MAKRVAVPTKTCAFLPPGTFWTKVRGGEVGRRGERGDEEEREKLSNE